jgi:hypothetical protein
MVGAALQLQSRAAGGGSAPLAVTACGERCVAEMKRKHARWFFQNFRQNVRHAKSPPNLRQRDLAVKICVISLAWVIGVSLGSQNGENRQ